MLDWVKGQPNPVRRGVRALLRNDNDTAEAQAQKLAISGPANPAWMASISR